MNNDIYTFGLVVKTKKDISFTVTADSLGIVKPSMKYNRGKLLVGFVGWGDYIVPRRLLETVACQRCHGRNYVPNAERIITRNKKDGEGNYSTHYEAVCEDCWDEEMFMEFWNFLTTAEIPSGFQLPGWERISAKQAGTIMYLLQERYELFSDTFNVCDECNEPFNSHKEPCRDIPGKGIFCWDCARQFGTDCEECGDFHLYEKLDDDGRCARCAEKDSQEA